MYILTNPKNPTSKRVFAVIDEKINIKENKSSKDLKIEKTEILFENINFKYPSTDEKAVKDINLKIKGGTMAAFVGHSGAGKSTILNLIPRFYDSQQGKILIDNQNIYER